MRAISVYNGEWNDRFGQDMNGYCVEVYSSDVPTFLVNPPVLGRLLLTQASATFVAACRMSFLVTISETVSLL